LSSKLWARVWELDIPHAESKVLMALCDHAQDVPGEPDLGINCFPSIRMIAWKTGYERRWVQRLLRNLAEKKIIIPKSFYLGKTPVEYEIHLENAKRKSEFRGIERSRLRGGLETTGEGRSPDRPWGRLRDRPVVQEPPAGLETIRPVVSTPPAGRSGDHPNPYITLREPSVSNRVVVFPVENNNSAAREYVEQVLKTFSEIHGASPSSADSEIAAFWFASKVPVEIVELALWEGAARHLMSGNFQRSLNLSYFKSIVEEELRSEVPLNTRQRYIEFVKFRMPEYVQMRTENKNTKETVQ